MNVWLNWRFPTSVDFYYSDAKYFLLVVSALSLISGSVPNKVLTISNVCLTITIVVTFCNLGSKQIGKTS